MKPSYKELFAGQESPYYYYWKDSSGHIKLKMIHSRHYNQEWYDNVINRFVEYISYDRRPLFKDM